MPNLVQTPDQHSVLQPRTPETQAILLPQSPKAGTTGVHHYIKQRIKAKFYFFQTLSSYSVQHQWTQRQDFGSNENSKIFTIGKPM